MNEQMKFPAGTAFGSIGHPIRRKEDARLLTGKGRFTDDFSLRRPDLCRDGALAASACAHRARSTPRAAQAMPGVLAVLTGADCTRRRPEADPAHAGAVDQLRHEADRPGRRRRCSPARTCCCPPTRRATSARRWRWWWRRRARRRWTPPRRSRSNTRSCRSSSRPSDALEARRAAGVGRSRRTTCWSTRIFGDKAATDRAFAQGRACGEGGVQHRPRHRRADGAARVRSAISTRRPAATRSMPAAAARCGRRPSWPACSASRRTSVRVLSYDVGGNFGTRNRPYRRIRPGAVGGGQAQAAGEIHRDALGGVPHRLPGPRPRHQGRAGVRRRRQIPRDARRQHQQRRRALRVAVAAVEGLGPDHRQLRHPGGDAARARGVHQHHADASLSLVRAGRR